MRKEIEDELARLYEMNPMTFGPAAVVDAARDPGSVLHDLVFDKDQPEAAEAYYLNNARDLIQRVHVPIMTEDRGPVLVRQYHAIPGEETPYRFASVEELMSDKSAFKEAMTEAVRRVSQAQKAVDDLSAITRKSKVRLAARHLGRAKAALTT